MTATRSVSVIIPVRNEAATIGRTVGAVLAQGEPGLDLEVIVVDDGSSDGTAEAAEAAGATVLRPADGADVGGNPAAARNLAARRAVGDILVFLDADCLPTEGWLAAILDAHAAGNQVVGGSLDLPPGLSLTARCDYYCGWYNVHSRRSAGRVPNHPPGNLSVRRELFLSTMMFEERQPIAFAHEELGWQAEVQRRGIEIDFEPRAVVQHFNRPGFGNLLRRNYRWAYSSIEAKAGTRAVRFAVMYEFPLLLIAAAPVLAVAQTGYILAQWARARRLEPLLLAPAVIAARVAYAAGTVAGGLRWLKLSRGPARAYRPRWE
jgi:glycosyltransferase involved in cell wall biosynthesis